MRALSLVRNTIALTALSALALGGSLTAASAQDTYYNTGTYTVDVAHSVFDDTLVGADSDLPPGDSLDNPGDGLLMNGLLGVLLFAFDSSQVTISGGAFGQASFGQPLGVNFFDLSTGGFTLIGHNLSGYVLNLGDSSAFTLQNVVPAAVPELSSLLGFGSFLALGGLAAFRQRKQARQAV
jgi:hypothetical protein